MARKAKVDVPEEELEALDNNVMSSQELGEKYSQPRSYFDNVKHRRKLKTSFALKTADPSMSNNQVKDSVPQMEVPSAQGQLGAPQINYHVAVKGLYKGADSIFKIMSVMSRGQVEYTNVTDQQLEDLASVTENDQAIQKIATMGGVSTIVTVGSILGTFGGQFKIKKKIKHDSKNPACKCAKCNVFKEDTAEPKPEDVISVENIKPVIPEQEEKARTEKLGEQITNAFNEKPKVDPNGMIIEKNVPKKTLTESQVIEQNTRNGNENF
jgi:hypothetical protein